MQDLNQVLGKRKIERKGKFVSRKICSLIITVHKCFWWWWWWAEGVIEKDFCIRWINVFAQGS
jgi:hypothetical protein